MASQLSSHLNHLHLSTSGSTHYTASHQQHSGYHSGPHQPATYQVPTAQGGPPYAAQQTPGGWTFSQTHILPQQVDYVPGM